MPNLNFAGALITDSTDFTDLCYILPYILCYANYAMSTKK